MQSASTIFFLFFDDGPGIVISGYGVADFQTAVDGNGPHGGIDFGKGRGIAFLDILLQHFGQFPVHGLELKLKRPHHKRNRGVFPDSAAFQPENQTFFSHSFQQIRHRTGVPVQSRGHGFRVFEDEGQL